MASAAEVFDTGSSGGISEGLDDSMYAKDNKKNLNDNYLTNQYLLH